jgi:hypothetical protein
VVRPGPAACDDGTRAATALLTVLVGLSVPFAAALGLTDQPVAAAGGGLFAVGCVLAVLAVRAVDRDPTNGPLFHPGGSGPSGGGL